MEKNELKGVVESLLFVSGDPVRVSRIVKITGVTKDEIVAAVQELSAEYSVARRGLMILQKGEDVQMATNPENIQYVEQLVKNELQDSLSPAALEVLSIIAYRGPISKTEIEAIRGVNCSYTVRNLLLRGLIERSDNPRDSRGFVYSISFDFLKKLGIEQVEKLPEYGILSKDDRINSIIAEK